MNKRYSEKTAAAVCRKLMHNSSGRDFTHYPWTDAEGRQCFCDGYRVYRLQKALPDMPVMPENLTPADPSRFFKPLEVGAVVEVPAPDAEAVRAFIKNPNRGKLPFDFGEDMPAANPNYLLDLLRLFPGAAWYVQERPADRESGAIYIVHDAGSALLMPCRKGKDAAARAVVREATEKAKREAAAVAAEKAKPSKEEPAVAESTDEPKPAPSWPTDLKYYIYARLPGEKKYYLADLGSGRVKVNSVYAPRYAESRLEEIKEILDEQAGEYPGHSFQIRRINGRTVVYTAVPTFTPELFAERVELSAMTPEQFAAAHAA